MQISMTMHGLPWVHAIISSSSSHWKSKARLEYHSVCFKVSTNQTVEYPLSLRTHCPSLHADQSQHAVIQIDGLWTYVKLHEYQRLEFAFWNVSLPTNLTVAAMTFKTQHIKLLTTRRQVSTALMLIQTNGILIERDWCTGDFILSCTTNLSKSLPLGGPLILKYLYIRVFDSTVW